MTTRRLIAALRRRPVVERTAAPIVVEFSSPNICKPFHVGHLRSTIIGRCVANMVEAAHPSTPVVRLNWLGDWGRQFGILAHAYSTQVNVPYSSIFNYSTQHVVDAQLRATLVNESPSAQECSNAVRKLVQLYVDGTKNQDANRDAIDRLQADLEHGPSTSPCRELWRGATRTSMIALDDVYRRINVRFDETHRESEYVDAANALVDTWRRQDLITTVDGVLGVHIKSGSTTKLNRLMKSDGSTLYTSRDLAAVLDRRRRWRPERIIYVVDDSQHHHFEGMRATLTAVGMDDDAQLIEHVSFGKIDGMSTRGGGAILLEDVLAAGVARCVPLVERGREKSGLADNDVEATATQLALSGLVVADLMRQRSSSFKFDWEKCLRTQGDTGVFLQLMHARLCSIFRKVVPLVIVRDRFVLGDDGVLDLVDEDGVHDAVEALAEAAADRQPCVLVQHTFRVARATGKLVNAVNVRGLIDDVDRRSDELVARVVLLHAARVQLAECLTIVGLVPLERC